MTWEVAAAIAETAGALGVIASLIYLANQVRNENRASAVAAKLETVKLLSDFQDIMILHPELMELLIKARRGMEALSDRERHIFSNMCLKAFWFFSAARFQLRIKALPEDDWAEMYAIMRTWLGSPGVRSWWQKIGRASFGGAFVSFIENEIAKIAAASATPSVGQGA